MTIGSFLETVINGVSAGMWTGLKSMWKYGKDWFKWIVGIVLTIGAVISNIFVTLRDILTVFFNTLTPMINNIAGLNVADGFTGAPSGVIDVMGVVDSVIPLHETMILLIPIATLYGVLLVIQIYKFTVSLFRAIKQMIPWLG